MHLEYLFVVLFLLAIVVTPILAIIKKGQRKKILLSGLGVSIVSVVGIGIFAPEPAKSADAKPEAQAAVAPTEAALTVAAAKNKPNDSAAEDSATKADPAQLLLNQIRIGTILQFTTPISQGHKYNDIITIRQNIAAGTLDQNSPIDHVSLDEKYRVEEYDPEQKIALLGIASNKGFWEDSSYWVSLAEGHFKILSTPPVVAKIDLSLVKDNTIIRFTTLNFKFYAQDYDILKEVSHTIHNGDILRVQEKLGFRPKWVSTNSEQSEDLRVMTYKDDLKIARVVLEKDYHDELAKDFWVSLDAGNPIIVSQK